MARIAVFDSGLGSLSVIRPIQRKVRAEIIYFADQASYPYGTKSTRELRRVINSTIKRLEQRFVPDVIVVASNTPSLLLNPERQKKILGVYPPLKEAAKKSKTGKIAVLATRSVVKSRKLQDFVNSQTPEGTKTFKIDASPLVDLVESGKFLSEKEFCKKKINEYLKIIKSEKVDVATLSSTHLPFLLPMLKKSFPGVTFLDPAESVADKIALLLKNKKPGARKMEIFASGSTIGLQKKLQRLGIRKKVKPL